jgi:hypothetical protein
MVTLDFRYVVFYSQLDEKVFFDFVRQIRAIPPMKRRLDPQVFRVPRRVSRDDLLSLIALCRRYDVDMRQLAPFARFENAAWFKNPRMHWYKLVFGRRARTATGGEGRRTRG